MKKCKGFLLLFLCIGVTSCSKDSTAIESPYATIQYLGSSVNQNTTSPTTQFLFSVTSKANTPLLVRVEALTIKKEKLRSETQLLQVGETTEISIQKSGMITDKDYMKNFSVQAAPANITLMPGVFLPKH